MFLARSGADGRYSMRGLGPRRYRLSAEDDRFVPWTRSVSVAAGQAETQDVPLARAATLTGRVVDTEGAPIEGARIQLAEERRERVPRLHAPDGRRGDRRAHGEGRQRSAPRALRPATTSGSTCATTTSRSARSAASRSRPAATKSGLTVVMRRGLSLRGVVKDDAGRPLAGAEVDLSGARSIRAGRGGMQMEMIGPGNQVRRETGADGRFEFRGLKPGDYAVAARRPGFARASVDPVKVAEGRAAEPLELVLRPGATISGVLHDKLGNGASGWYVTRARARARAAARWAPASNRTEEPTGPDGAFLLEGLTPGESYELQVMGVFGPRSAQGRRRRAGRRHRAHGDRHRPDPRPRRGRRQRSGHPRLPGALRARRAGRNARS